MIAGIYWVLKKLFKSAGAEDSENLLSDITTWEMVFSLDKVGIGLAKYLEKIEEERVISPGVYLDSDIQFHTTLEVRQFSTEVLDIYLHSMIMKYKNKVNCKSKR